MNDRIDRAVSDLEEIALAAQVDFGRLSNGPLNWKPTPQSWSVAQCFDHLITINRLYFPLFDSMSAGPAKPTFWERYSPFSGLFGRLLIKAVSPEYPRKVKTRPIAEPSASRIDAGIVSRFAEHQDELIAHLRRIPDDVDLNGTIITSPLSKWMTYSLEDCLTILVVHEKRHLQQARRVTEAEGFPER